MLSLVRATVIATALAAPAVSAAAGGLSVSPVLLAFPTETQMQTLEISNPGDAATDVQVRLFAWTLVAGEDHLAPSADIGFSPPMFRLEPGAKQIVRLAALRPREGDEKAYRLFVDQLPRRDVGGLQMPVRMALPLFVAPAGATVSSQASLSWRVSFDAKARKAFLVARNDGPQRVKLMDLAYVAEDKVRPVSPGLSGYVLAGAERSWVFAYDGRPAALQLQATLANGAAMTARAIPAPE